MNRSFTIVLILFVLTFVSCKKKDIYEINKIDVYGFSEIKDTITRKTLVNFYFFNCSGCIYETLEIKKLCDKNKIQLINITTSERDVDSLSVIEMKNESKKLKILNNFIIDTNCVSKKSKNPYSVLKEYSKKIKINYAQVQSAPYLVLINEKGKILNEFDGKNQFEKYINK